jgi:NAD(P)-dependent dehydrogenase (short-subunit alcohol dehydrogenase family)
MDYAGKTVAITGGARGIGRAFAKMLVERGAKVAIGDLAGADETAAEIGAIGATVDVTKEAQIRDFVELTEDKLGPIDVFVSNAGILRTDEPGWGASEADDKAWQDSFEVNVMGAVRSARCVVPGMAERGSGVFVIIASAAGLLGQIGATSYTCTKHAAVAFAESLSVAHGDQGVQTVCVCPQAVRTDMLGGSEDGGIAGADGIVEPEDVVAETLKAIEEKRFLALPHPQVKDYEAVRAMERDRWLGGMRKFRRLMVEARGRPV